MTLTFNDEPIIKRAIYRRVGAEPGVKILAILVKQHKDCISVGVLWHVHDKVIGRSVFDLPHQFELQHVVNECDEIAEQIKAAWKDMRFTAEMFPEKGAQSEVKSAIGNGRRGQWDKREKLIVERAN